MSETPEQRAKRKALEAEAAAKRASETPEERAKRKAAEARRAKETPEERAKRKAADEAAAARRAQETPEERAKRKAAEEERAKRRSQETPEERAKRIAREVEAAKRKAQETPEERAKRIAREVEAAKLRAQETPEARAKRKAREAEAAKRRAQETPEQRAKRKAAELKALESKAKRQALGDGTASPGSESGGASSPGIASVNGIASATSAPGGSGGGLFDDLPEPDPEKDAIAAAKGQAAERRSAPQQPIDYVEDRTKVVFLDIDGVLRPLASGQFQMSSLMMNGEAVPLVDEQNEFRYSALAALRTILEETGAILVLSSEWRRHPALREGVDSNLKYRGLPAVKADTPLHERPLIGDPLRSFALRRAQEIGEYLQSQPHVRRWVALDDIDLSMADEDRKVGQPAMAPRLVLTDKTECLTREDALLAISILNGKPSSVAAAT